MSGQNSKQNPSTNSSIGYTPTLPSFPYLGGVEGVVGEGLVEQLEISLLQDGAGGDGEKTGQQDPEAER